MIYSTLLRWFQSLVFVISSLLVCAHSEVTRPRGVSLAKASLFSPTKDFTCFDGTITIPFNYVNDDYCDCFDGSDEPGTSACLNGVFHCTNAGHQAQNIPSSRVNDGICDCCDGTDEYSVPDTCANTCDEMGREAKAEAQRLADLHKAGSQLRIELIEKGNKKRTEMAEQLTQLEKDKADADKIKDEKEALKQELESKENEALKVYREAEEQEKEKKVEQERENEMREATEHFVRYDSNSDGVLSIDEIKVVNVFDKNKDSVVDEEEIAYFFVNQENIDRDSFVSTTWPLLKPLLMMEKGMFQPAGEEERETEAEEPSEDLDAEDLGHDEEDIDQALPQDDNEDLDHELPLEEPQGYDEQTQELVNEATEARRQFTEAERTVREIESSIRHIKESLEKDYGLQQEYATLDGQCFEHEDKEYVYRLCMFQKVTQKAKNGGSEVGLGNWGEWDGVDNKYSVMKYTNGVACWNGPSRTTSVYINCGMETRILSVTEPYRCEYQINLSTPAACDGSTPQKSSHDEL